jgi:predicted metalloendopeptidase
MEKTLVIWGVNAAYDGLQLYLKENGNLGLIDGYTPEQRFFISWYDLAY